MTNGRHNSELERVFKFICDVERPKLLLNRAVPAVSPWRGSPGGSPSPFEDTLVWKGIRTDSAEPKELVAP